MAIDLSNTLIVAISATALFDLTDAEQHFQQLILDDPDTAIERFRSYMYERENLPLNTGTGYPLIRALLNLNRYQPHHPSEADKKTISPLVEVVIMSKSSPDTGIQVLNALRTHGIPISRSAFTSGEPVADYVEDFKVDLFLTTNHADAQSVTDKGVCACAILDAPPVDMKELDTEQLRIAFDGDAVLFDEQGELLSQTKGLKAFHDYEAKFSDTPMQKGPYADFLIKLSKLQKRLPTVLDNPPIQIALVTARNAPADLRAIKTLRAWGVNVDLAFFLGGLDKSHVLQTFAPHIFFDDSIKNYDSAKGVVPSGLVPYKSESALYKPVEKENLVEVSKS
ncbi:MULTISPECIES: 5'-nucleotidase [unclassified Moraxella]|uniref:5'-nucleotidase n=1 Tax=unclassified Moraxella TaxID=2685852 RepID=UPI003AF92553